MPRGGRKIVDPLPAIIAFYNVWFSPSKHKASLHLPRVLRQHLKRFPAGQFP